MSRWSGYGRTNGPRAGACPEAAKPGDAQMTTTVRSAPTRGTEAEGARLHAVPVGTGPAVPRSESAARAVGDAPAGGDLAEVAAGTLGRARDHLLGLPAPRGRRRAGRRRPCRGGRGHARPRPRPPARPAGPARLVDRRARD